MAYVHRDQSYDMVTLNEAHPVTIKPCEVYILVSTGSVLGVDHVTPGSACSHANPVRGVAVRPHHGVRVTQTRRKWQLQTQESDLCLEDLF